MRGPLRASPNAPPSLQKKSPHRDLIIAHVAAALFPRATGTPLGGRTRTHASSSKRTSGMDESTANISEHTAREKEYEGTNKPRSAASTPRDPALSGNFKNPSTFPDTMGEEEGKGGRSNVSTMLLDRFRQCSVPYPCTLAARDRVSGTVPPGQGYSR